MVVHKKYLSSGKPSNKAPHTPPSPDPALFSQSVTLINGKTVWFALPLPDKLSFNSYILAKHFEVPKGEGQGGDGGLASLVMKFGEGLSHAQLVYGSSKPGFFAPEPKRLIAKAQLRLGKRGASVHLELTRKTSKDQMQPGFLLRADFNPRKLGQPGIALLIEVLQQAATVPLDVPALLANATVSRLDVALDLAGLTPGELVLLLKDKAKVVTYRSSSGQLETVQLHREKKLPTQPSKGKLRPLGKLLLKAYDRNAQRKALGKPPPYPGHQITRLEVVRLRFKAGFGLADLPSLPDPFSHVCVCSRDDLDPWADLARWRAYVSCRETMGAWGAIEALELAADEIEAAHKAFAFKGASLVPPDAWGNWSSGLAWCGLSDLIALAAEA